MNFICKSFVALSSVCLASCLIFFSTGLHHYENYSIQLEDWKKEILMSPFHAVKKSLLLSSCTNQSITITGKIACADNMCSNLLSRQSYHTYQAIQKHCNPKEEHIESSCVFRNGSGFDPVALISHPGSGNTWVRGLLEKATGICTGAIYRDCSLWKSGFVGEGIYDGSVIATKTHSLGAKWKDEKASGREKYGSAILLVRNPFNALIADRNRITARGHVNIASKSKFGENKGWDDFVHTVGEKWKRRLLSWLLSAHQLNYPLIVIRYEDLKKDKVEQVSRMLEFLHQNYNRTELAAQLADGFNQFHRQHTTTEDYEHFTQAQRDFVNSIIKSAIEELQSAGIDSDELRLNEYLE